MSKHSPASFNPSTDQCPICRRGFKHPDCPHTYTEAVLRKEQDGRDSHTRRVVREVIREELARETPVTYKALHENLDRLLAAYISETGKRPSETPIIELLYWAHKKAQAE